MANPDPVALIHAEIDGELDERGRADLARAVLADQQLRTLREDLRHLATTLDAIEPVEPPRGLLQGVLDALPHPAPRRARPWGSATRWRYAAMVAGVLAAGALWHATSDAPGPAATELAGTLASARPPVVLQTVRLAEGPVAGRVSLYRDDAGLGLDLELEASAPLDVRIASGGRTLEVERPATAQGGTVRGKIPLPGIASAGQAIDLTFVVAGRQVGTATLQVPATR